MKKSASKPTYKITYKIENLLPSTKPKDGDFGGFSVSFVKMERKKVVEFHNNGWGLHQPKPTGPNYFKGEVAVLIASGEALEYLKTVARIRTTKDWFRWEGEKAKELYNLIPLHGAPRLGHHAPNAEQAETKIENPKEVLMINLEPTWCDVFRMMITILETSTGDEGRRKAKETLMDAAGKLDALRQQQIAEEKAKK